MPMLHVAVHQTNRYMLSPHLRSAIELETAELHLTEETLVLVTLPSFPSLTPPARPLSAFIRLQEFRT